MRRVVVVALVLFVLCLPRVARGGGLEYPDNGAEAMGRGAAFTAKADDGTALMYNVAGFARRNRLGAGSASPGASPHTGGLTPAAVDHQANEVVAQLRELAHGRIPRGALNPAHARRLASLT